MIDALVTAVALSSSPSQTPVEPPAIVRTLDHPSMSGVRPSEYTGRKYKKSQEKFRKCVLRRESNGHYFSTNRDGGYFGGYQMRRALAVGAAWMMRDELRDMFGVTVGTEISRKLRVTEPHKWARFYQDMAFYVVLNAEGTGSGAKHWRGGRFSCALR